MNAARQSQAKPQPTDLNHRWTQMDTDFTKGTEPTEGEEDGHEKARKDTKTEGKNFIAACEQVGLLQCRDAIRTVVSAFFASLWLNWPPKIHALHDDFERY